MTTPKQPATEAGREQDLTNAAFLLLAAYPDESPEARQWLIDRLLEVQAEAAAGLLALREALDRELARLVGLADKYAGPGPGSVGSLVDLQNVYGAFEALRRTLDTAPAAAEIEARIDPHACTCPEHSDHAGCHEHCAHPPARRYATLLKAETVAVLQAEAIRNWLASPEAEQRLAAAIWGEPAGQPGTVERQMVARGLAALREQPATEEAG